MYFKKVTCHGIVIKFWTFLRLHLSIPYGTMTAMNQTSKITTKKQITLPNYVMDALNLSPAQKVVFLIDEAEPNVAKIKKIPDLMELKGSIKTRKKFDDEKADKIVTEYIGEQYRKKWKLP